MLKSSRSVALILISTMAVFFGFKSCLDRGYYEAEGGTTQPSGGARSSHYFWGSGYRGNRGSGSKSVQSGTSRGGFGSSGHAAGS